MPPGGAFNILLFRYVCFDFVLTSLFFVFFFNRAIVDDVIIITMNLYELRARSKTESIFSLVSNTNVFEQMQQINTFV